ncbi:MAG: HEAT repeat domain-containing protein [Bacillota bacterium]|nr:HEAT repeat domain-containing protein [Bacillota bacterium]
MTTNELAILSVLAVSILLILVLLLLYLIIRKSIDLKRHRKIEAWKKTYNPLIFSVLSDGIYSRGLSPSTPTQIIAIEELLSRYSKVLEWEEQVQSLTDLAAHYLTDYYRKRLTSKKWSTRMNTLYHIRDLRLFQLADDVRLLVDNKRISHEELLHALRILACSNHPDLLELLTNTFVRLSAIDYRTILICLEKNRFSLFMLQFHQCQPTLQKAILEVISTKKDMEYLSFVKNIFSSCSGEVRLAALKALAEIGFVENTDPFLELLYSNKWEERMMAAKLMGSLREERAISRLKELLHDPSWWVRSQAGQAISEFANGKEILQSVLDQSNDLFAKDMAWEWLNKGV